MDVSRAMKNIARPGAGENRSLKFGQNRSVGGRKTEVPPPAQQTALIAHRQVNKGYLAQQASAAGGGDGMMRSSVFSFSSKASISFRVFPLKTVENALTRRRRLHLDGGGRCNAAF